MNTTLVAGKEFLEREINGYVVFDSKKALLNITQTDIPWIHSITLNKAVIFTESSSGKTIMSAIKIGGFKPGCVILHGSIRMPDDLALRIANAEEIPLAVSRIASIDKFLEKLKNIQ
jgi:putative transcriptional regulator